MHSIEDCGRDIEPALIQVRNELINENNFELRHGDEMGFVANQREIKHSTSSIPQPFIFLKTMSTRYGRRLKVI